MYDGLQDVSDIRGKNISQVVEGFTAVEAGVARPENWPSAPLLLARLAKQTSEVHGGPEGRTGRMIIKGCL